MSCYCVYFTVLVGSSKYSASKVTITNKQLQKSRHNSHTKLMMHTVYSPVPQPHELPT